MQAKGSKKNEQDKKEIVMLPRTGIEPVTFRLYDSPLQPNVISNYTIEG